MRDTASPRSDSFERFYLKNVAQSEGCGCAEQVIRRGVAVKAGDSLCEIIAALKGRFGGRGSGPVGDSAGEDKAPA